MKNMKVCLVGSSGGHLTHLYMLKPFWKNKERFWVTFDKEDARSLLEDEKMYPCYYPTNRSLKALIKNTKIAWRVLKKEKPDLIISCGAAVAVPFFYLGKLMGAKLVYIEVFDRIDKPKIYAIGGIQKCADQFVDCSPFEVLAYFRNAEEVITDTFHGSIFSIITHRPFTTLIRKSVGNSYGNEEKLSDLLKRLELNTRMTTKIESVENINEQVINYEKIDEILKTHRKVARQYLQKNLEG